MKSSARLPTFQAGIVLPLSLVMLVLVTLLAVVALRGVTTEERIAANLRASSVAFEQAEMALRHCEAIAWNGGAPLADARFDSLTTSGSAWSTETNWGDARVRRPPTSQYVMTGVTVKAPECMIETIRAAPDPTVHGTRVPTEAFALTARGYGDNAATPNFRATVQSQLRP